MMRSSIFRKAAQIMRKLWPHMLAALLRHHIKQGNDCTVCIYWGAFDGAKNHKRQRRKRQSVTAKREKSQTPKFV